jgi:hypothetical protein
MDDLARGRAPVASTATAAQGQMISGKSLILQYNMLLGDEVETHGAARP